jgi:hypothetical protein
MTVAALLAVLARCPPHWPVTLEHPETGEPIPIEVVQLFDDRTWGGARVVILSDVPLIEGTPISATTWRM